MEKIPKRLVLAALTTILTTTWPLLAAAGGTETTTGFVNVEAGRLYYEEAGEGPAVVFLHDGLLPSSTWDEQIGPWSRHHRVIRYDRRAFGQSPPAEAPYSDLGDLLALFDALAVDRAAIVGASSGGQLAVDYTLAHPERVDALVLVGAVVGGMGYSNHFLARNWRHEVPLHTGGGVQDVIERLVGDPYLTAASSTAARSHVREALEANLHHLTGPWGRRFRQRPDFEALERLGEIRVPTLVVVGEADIPDVHAHAGVLETGIEGAKRVVLPAAGHLVHLERPAAFNELVLDFLAPVEERARKLLASVERLDIGTLLPLFDYDREAPLDVEQVGTESRGQATVVDLSYASPAGGRVPAFLVLPAAEGPHPAVIFVHPGPGDRSSFVGEAVELAGLGVVSLSIDAPHRRPDAPRPTQIYDADDARHYGIQMVVDLRRAVDLLRSRDEVDSERIAYVGHRLGATFGAVLAGVETRLAGYVLMAGHASVSYSFRHGEHRSQLRFRTLLTPEKQARYLEATLPFDAVHYLHRAAPAPILFQCAKGDEYVPEAAGLAFFELAGEPKKIEWYDTDHFFDEPARKSRRRWLGKLLGLDRGSGRDKLAAP